MCDVVFVLLAILFWKGGRDMLKQVSREWRQRGGGRF